MGYGIYYGLIETSGRTGLPPPGRSWQVPARWVDNVSRSRRILIWGSLLGPGFATRNPYAGFGVLFLIVCSAGSIRLGVTLAVTIGLLHGLARAAALLRDVHRPPDTDYLDRLAQSMRLRALDGFALLTIAGAATAAIAFHG